MKLRAAAVLLLSLALTFSVRAASEAGATPRPSLMDKTLEILHLKHSPRSKTRPDIHHNIELQLDIEPSQIQLSNTRQVQVGISVYNRAQKDFVHLNFPTSQRFEILVRDSSGKVVTTWSEDQSFTDDPATITVNPGERLQYSASVATREMSAGQPYIIEVSFPSYPDLTIQQQVIPRN